MKISMFTSAFEKTERRIYRFIKGILIDKISLFSTNIVTMCHFTFTTEMRTLVIIMYLWEYINSNK